LKTLTGQAESRVDTGQRNRFNKQRINRIFKIFKDDCQAIIIVLEMLQIVGVGVEQAGLRRLEVDGESRERSRELENRLGRAWDLDRFSDEEGYRDRTRHSHIRYRYILMPNMIVETGRLRTCLLYVSR
jgi:hypothetical protein